MADRLNSGDFLQRGQALESQNGNYGFRLQDDGNLVLYSALSGGRAIWSSRTAGRAVRVARLEENGDFAIYGFGNEGIIWNTGTSGLYNPYLIVQNDGNVVLYGIKAAWETGTVGRDPISIFHNQYYNF